MNARDHTFAVALTASLLLHAGTALVLLDGYARGSRPLLDAPPRPPQAIDYVVRPTSPPEQLLFGDAQGTGTAANTAPGENELAALKGNDQAFLSRDPVGAGQVGDEPSMSVLPVGDSIPATPRPSEPSRAVIGVADGVDGWSAPRNKRAMPAVDKTNVASEQTARSSTPPADPAIMSESESDPFSRSENVVFRDGRVEARFGRKIKTVRPRLSLAAQYDLLGMQFPRMVVRVRIDTTGSVRRVEIVRSTGSDSADQEVKVALYQWWFEPKKRGEETVEFPIVWR